MLEFITQSVLLLSLLALGGLALFRVYDFVYKQGYAHGKHAGFSEGLWKGYNSKNKKKIGVHHDITL